MVSIHILIMGIIDPRREDEGYLRISMTGLGLLLFLCWSGLVMWPVANLSALDSSSAPAQPADAFEAAVKSFNLLSSFFSDSDIEDCDIYPVSRHGRSYAEAYDYLLAGFEAGLADDILKAYTFTGPDGTLRIIPCEGIPLLTVADRAQAAIIPQEDCTLIKVRLADCYQPGDSYIYQITSRLIEGNWKITDLSLTEE